MINVNVAQKDDMYGKPCMRVTVVALARFYSLTPEEAERLAAELLAAAKEAKERLS